VRRRFALMLVIFALAVRMTIPAGWMPSADHSFAINVCTGINMSTVWIDTKGQIHKSDPEKHKSAEHEACAFAGLAMAADLAQPDSAVSAPLMQANIAAKSIVHSSIGRGLAAPPPPSTGPPSYI
jgi:hypothetical protein